MGVMFPPGKVESGPPHLGEGGVYKSDKARQLRVITPKKELAEKGAASHSRGEEPGGTNIGPQRVGGHFPRGGKTEGGVHPQRGGFQRIVFSIY